MSLQGGYAGQVLYVDLTRGELSSDPLDGNHVKTYLGGRGLNVARLFETVGPNVSPLDPENLLIFGVGPLGGTLFPGGARFNVTGKSPQTGILGDSNAGGFWGPELKFAGYDQVVIKGKAPIPSYLLITSEKVEICPAVELWGLDTWQTNAALRQIHSDPRIQIATVGPAAENGVKFAGIFTNLVRPAARTGLGTLMAAKNLKAVVVRGSGPVKVFDPQGFRTVLSEIEKKSFPILSINRGY